MAQSGGIGVIHKNNKIEEQVREVEIVKRFESGMVINPITVRPDDKLKDILALKKIHGVSGFPVTDKNGTLLGIITNRDVRFAENPNELVENLMTKKNLLTVPDTVKRKDAISDLTSTRVEKLIVVDKKNRCVGLITVSDIKKILIIGAGPIVIGQACEFDYSGAQACKSLKEEGYEVVLINSNPATIMTDPDLSDKTYIEPITKEFVTQIIELEKQISESNAEMR